MLPLAEVDTTKIDAKDHITGAAEATGKAVNHFVVQCSAMQRMWMADQCSTTGITIIGFLEQRFQPARRAGNEQ